MKEQSARKLEQIQALLSRGSGEEAPISTPHEQALKWLLHFNLEHVYGPREIEISENELVVVCLVRDGKSWINAFVEHYRALGAKHIVFLDNGSTDGTPEAAQDYENVTVLRTKLPFKVYQMAMKQYLMERFGRQRWTLCVDVDELFDYPYSDIVSLESFLRYLGERSYTAVAAQMLDMFSDEPLADAEVDGEHEPLKESYRFYDVSNVQRQKYSESPLAEISGSVPDNAGISVFRGGIQEITFNSRALLTKHPLVFVDERVKPMNGSAHVVSNARIADVSCVLFHYKFTRRLYDQVRRAARQENYMRDSHKHKKHLAVLEKTPLLQLTGENARELESVDELVHNGFLIVSEEYMNLVEYQERKHAGQKEPRKLMEAFLETSAEAVKLRHSTESRIRDLQASLSQQERQVRRLERQNKRLEKKTDSLTIRLQRSQQKFGGLPGRTFRIPVRILGKVRRGFVAIRKRMETEESFEDVKKYCMFIGYPRSGHSLIGSLLDAHPNVVMAHELDALKYVEEGIDRKALYRLLLKTSRDFTESGSEWEGYKYRVPNQWQGRFETLEVIGDKKGGASTQVLDSNPNLLGKLQETVGAEVKLIHVIRNPYDNISTMFNQRRANRSLRATIRNYFSMCDSNTRIKDRVGKDSVFEMRHEDFVGDPKTHLNGICGFLGLECTDGYLEDCAGLVFESPRKTRDQIEWNPGALERVREGISQYDFLSGYSFES